jgi:proteasome lid subunit RPN8/RPN11
MIPLKPSIKWNEAKPDVLPANLSSVLPDMDAGTVVHVVANLLAGKRIYMNISCRVEVMAHIRTDRNEVGGLLIGRAWRNDLFHNGPPVVMILRAIPGADCINSPVSLQMGTRIWQDADQHVNANEYVVGWYHSHPGLGAFFSGTDRFTQRNFFHHDYSTGWVIDPLRQQEKIFTGPGSTEYAEPLILMDDLQGETKAT